MENFLNTPKTLFLIDGIGAIVSAIMLGLILPYYKSYIGMPTYILQWLALAAVGFAIYSLTCFIINPTRWSFFLKIIGLINLTYCVVSLGILFQHYSQLTAIGIAYFVLEKIIVLSIATVELKVARQN